MRLQLILAAVIVVLALIGGSFLYGMSIGRERQRAAFAANAQRAEAAARRIVRAAHTHDQRLAAAQAARRTEFREIVREVPSVVVRPVYRNVCIDDDGVHLLERAVAAANGEPAPIGRAAGAGAESRADPDRH